jgi:DNA-binding response OmpR family regulator
MRRIRIWENMDAIKHVLIIYREEEICLLLTHGLKKLGANYKIITARDTAEALILAQQYHFNLILLETNIPNEAVLETTQTLHSLSPWSKIIWITSCDSLTYRLQVEKVAIDGTIFKPFKLADVRLAVQQATQGNGEAINPTAYTHRMPCPPP